jgi:hypothetical protein
MHQNHHPQKPQHLKITPAFSIAIVRFVMPTQTRKFDVIALVYARLQHFGGTLPAEDRAREWIDGLGDRGEGQASRKLKRERLEDQAFGKLKW